MRRLHCALLAAVALFGSASTAFATDVAPVKSWDGVYIGLHLGAGENSGDVRADYLPFPAFGVRPSFASSSGSGFAGGAQLGYNWRFAPRWLIGVEADYSRTHMDSSVSVIPITVLNVLLTFQPTTWTRNLNWLASARTRLGYMVMPDVLAYATGGVAWGGFDYNNSFINPAPGNSNWVQPFSATSSGYVLGGGAEWMFARNWVLRGEYLFYHLRSKSNLVINPSFPAFPIRFTWDATNTHVGRVAISYLFN